MFSFKFWPVLYFIYSHIMTNKIVRIVIPLEEKKIIFIFFLYQKRNIILCSCICFEIMKKKNVKKMKNCLAVVRVSKLMERKIGFEKQKKKFLRIYVWSSSELLAFNETIVRFFLGRILVLSLSHLAILGILIFPFFSKKNEGDIK